MNGLMEDDDVCVEADTVVDSDVNADVTGSVVIIEDVSDSLVISDDGCIVVGTVPLDLKR